MRISLGTPVFKPKTFPHPRYFFLGTLDPGSYGRDASEYAIIRRFKFENDGARVGPVFTFLEHPLIRACPIWQRSSAFFELSEIVLITTPVYTHARWTLSISRACGSPTESISGLSSTVVDLRPNVQCRDLHFVLSSYLGWVPARFGTDREFTCTLLARVLWLSRTFSIVTRLDHSSRPLSKTN